MTFRCLLLLALAACDTTANSAEREMRLQAYLTSIDAERVRKKRDPGRCFRKAGWREDGWTYPNRPDRSKLRLVKDWAQVGQAA